MSVFFNPSKIIEKKRNGEPLSDDEIFYFVNALLSGDFADYQASSLLMAIFFQGMSTAETVALTKAMAFSGKTMEWKGISRPLADKHSTGGVGDKVSILLAPLASACGLAVPMMSGRGLGHTGGTTDKLESIPGFSTQLDEKQARDQLQKIGVVMLSQSQAVAPADRILYALRDVTATIESIPLITASILSKKVAEGAHSLLLDVKVGNGAFMQTLPEAKRLASSIVYTANHLGVKCRALVTDMNQPLGCTAGHLLELAECIGILKGEDFSKSLALDSETTKPGHSERQLCSADLIELTLHSCAQMLLLAGVVKNLAEGRKLAVNKLRDGSAYDVFRKMVAAQGGQLDFIENPQLWKKAKAKGFYFAKHSGYLSSIQTRLLGNLLVQLGGGRLKVGDPIDPTVGFIFHAKLGCPVAKGQPILEVHAPDHTKLKSCLDQLDEVIEISKTRKARPKLIYECIDTPKRSFSNGTSSKSVSKKPSKTGKNRPASRSVL